MALDPRDAFIFNPIGAHTSNSSLSSAVTLTPAAGASKLMAQALTQNIRYTLGGTTPTSTLGFQMKAGDPPIQIPLGGDTSVKLIEEAATANLQYQWGS